MLAVSSHLRSDGVLKRRLLRLCYVGSNPCDNLGFSSMELDVDSVLYAMLNDDFTLSLAGFGPVNTHFALNVKLVTSAAVCHTNGTETGNHSGGDYRALKSTFHNFTWYYTYSLPQRIGVCVWVWHVQVSNGGLLMEMHC